MMLVLKRRLNQAIRIGGNVTVRVLRVDRGGNVRLGISAPAETTVHREEVQRTIDREREGGDADGPRDAA